MRDAPLHGDGTIPPEEVLNRVLSLNPHLALEDYYSERSIFYNPGRVARLGTIVASVKDHDGPNDAKSRLSRRDVYRFAFQLSRVDFVERFGAVPARPPKGSPVLIEQDPSVLDELTPHPVYAWMRWVQVLCPSRAHFQALLPLVEMSLDSVRQKWVKRVSSG